METLRQIGHLVAKEFLLEWRGKYALGGIVLYVLSTVFIVYNGFVRLQPPVWNALFWIITLFTSVNAVAKSFVGENSPRQLYLYSLARPSAIIFSKTIYNSLLLFFLNTLTYFAFGIVAGNPVRDTGLFFLALALGSLGMASTLTFISAIANKARNASTLMAILSFPLLIPLLVSLIKISASALGVITDTSVDQDIITLLAMDAIILGAAYLLFPFLWRD